MEQQSLSQATDEELMIAYQKGESAAFDILYKRHSGRVYGFLKLRLRDRAQVDDVFQGTFLKLHDHRAQYNDSLPFTPWLFTICRSVLVDAVRKNATIREDHESIDIETVPAQSPESALELPDLTLLSADQRRAIELRYRQELSFEEIAKKLETSPTNARQLISRAVTKLRNLSKSKRSSK
jgi:RNA polymerase sigma factor (sigma-70 family)